MRAVPEGAGKEAGVSESAVYPLVVYGESLEEAQHRAAIARAVAALPPESDAERAARKRRDRCCELGLEPDATDEEIARAEIQEQIDALPLDSRDAWRMHELPEHLRDVADNVARMERRGVRFSDAAFFEEFFGNLSRWAANAQFRALGPEVERVKAEALGLEAEELRQESDRRRAQPRRAGAPARERKVEHG